MVGNFRLFGYKNNSIGILIWYAICQVVAYIILINNEFKGIDCVHATFGLCAVFQITIHLVFGLGYVIATGEDD